MVYEIGGVQGRSPGGSGGGSSGRDPLEALGFRVFKWLRRMRLTSNRQKMVYDICGVLGRSTGGVQGVKLP